ncbi:H/ACA ribonucleoprotein complex subunit 1 [Nematocida major]|uniref:H/ACA ribonucleoprotein complex subunit 1 n=1 Tax=Nematocida major TaxID=1912982 RepID=UPI002008D624|nr:H/ACA ribonucleoprotein complex subunit 1 [Nematocida major]KAH9386980.1 H/ACA ribonucleoprotein complex subunit 1 [Nematocida major]
MARAPRKETGSKKTARDWPQMKFGKRESRESPENLVKIGTFSHAVKNTNMLVIRLSEGVIPFFNAGVYGEGERKVADIHEIFGKFNDHVYASIVLDGKLSPSAYGEGSVFRADKFRCLSFDRVKGASQVQEVKKAASLPKQFVRGRGSNFRTNAHNERAKHHADAQIRQTRMESRDSREKRKEFARKTVEKRGSALNLQKRKTFSYEE